MTGIGFGIARETRSTAKRWLAPIVGYFGAVFLHFVWNMVATLSGTLVLVMLPIWFVLVLAFCCLVLWLVVRKGRIIRDHLKDEIFMGNLTEGELRMVTSFFGRWKAHTSYGGKAGRKFVDAAARLALSKWHADRAMGGRKRTVSADFVVPLRQQLHTLRAEVSRALGRAVEQPRAWAPPQAGGPSPYAQHPNYRPAPQGGPQGGYGGGGQGGGYGGPQGGQGGATAAADRACMRSLKCALSVITRSGCVSMTASKAMSTSVISSRPGVSARFPTRKSSLRQR